MSASYDTTLGVGSDNAYNRLSFSGRFNRDLIINGTATYATLTSAYLYPLSYDLDNDGEKEIVVLDGTDLFIYRGSSLAVVNGIATGITAGTTNTQLYVYDVYGDGNPLIMIGTDIGVKTFRLESDVLVANFSYNWDSAYAMGTNHILACKARESCMSVGGMNTGLRANFFNSSVNAPSTAIIDYADYTYLSWIPQMQVIDWDGDGITEYAFSNWAHSTGLVYTQLFGVTNRTVSVEKSVNMECSGTLGERDSFTPPLVKELYSANGVYKEAVVACQADIDEFTIQVKTLDGVNKHWEFPLVYHASGLPMSAIIEANAFSDTSGYKDFCVVGFSKTELTQDILCSSLDTTSSSVEYYYDTSNTFNVSHVINSGDLVYSPLAYGVEWNFSSNSNSAGQSFTEFLTPYGVFSIDRDRFYDIFLIKRVASLDFGFPFGLNASIIADSGDGSSYAHIIALSTNNLVYLSDGTANSKSQFQEVRFNPDLCNNAVKTNTSIQVQVKAFDIDYLTDKIQFNMSAYADSENEIRYNWSANQTVGSNGTSLYTFAPFIANVSGTNFKIIVRARDTGTMTVVDYEQLFNVDETGVVFQSGSCTKSFTITLNPNLVGVTTTTTIPSTAQDFFTGLQETLGIAKFILWILVMLIIGVLTWIYGSHKNPAMAMGVIGIMEFFLFIIGVYWGLISVAWLIIIGLVCITIVGIFVARAFTHAKGSG